MSLFQKSVVNKYLAHLDLDQFQSAYNKFKEFYGDSEVDVMVYKQYNLTFDEVKLVDSQFWMSEEE